MTTKIEEVARAICEVMHGAGSAAHLDKTKPEYRKELFDLARAAIEAMKTPTPEMVRRMDAQAKIPAPVAGYWERIHHAAIDAALNEGKE